MNRAFEQIALIQGVIAAAFVLNDGALGGWCANSAISPENLALIGVTCQGVLSANRAAEEGDAQTGVAAFGPRTLIFRGSAAGLFLAYLDSTTNDAVVDWLFDQVNPLLAEEGVVLK